ncbi:MAG: hypothetical protein IT342_05755, partial [Candidatus Melainabacteria bacterium]|nr:hypothetical protein [Candidatus Melainabacteria bacterium]
MMSTDEKPEKRENEASEPAGGSEKKSSRRITFRLFGADKSGDGVVVGQGSNTTEKGLSESKRGQEANSSQRPRKLISIEELKELAKSSHTEARFAQDLLANVGRWQNMPFGPDRDAYGRKQQIAAMGMFGRAIEELESAETISPTAIDVPSSVVDVQTNAAPHVNPNIVETKAVFLETADLRALREEDLALGKRGGPAEQFLGLLDNFRKILKPGKEKDAAVRRVKRMAISLLSGRL